MRNRYRRLLLGLLVILGGLFIFTLILNRYGHLFYYRSIGCPQEEIQQASHKLTDRLQDYMTATKKNGITPLDNEAAIKSAEQLVSVSDSEYYIIDDLTHSYPYLTEDGLALLNKIGERFHQKLAGTSLAGTKFIVTSLTRTKESVSRLTKSNGNAVTNSPHLYGVSFDITYSRFHLPYTRLRSCHKQYLKEALAQAIQEQREKDNCWATKEKNQPCFHVVVQ